MDSDSEDSYMANAERAAKQNYLREEILESGYEPSIFVEYCEAQRGSDVDLWSFEDLKACVAEFRRQYKALVVQLSQQDEPTSDGLSLNSRVASHEAYRSHRNAFGDESEEEVGELASREEVGEQSSEEEEADTARHKAQKVEEIWGDERDRGHAKEDLAEDHGKEVAADDEHWKEPSTGAQGEEVSSEEQSPSIDKPSNFIEAVQRSPEAKELRSPHDSAELEDRSCDFPPSVYQIPCRQLLPTDLSRASEAVIEIGQ